MNKGESSKDSGKMEGGRRGKVKMRWEERTLELKWRKGGPYRGD